MRSHHHCHRATKSVVCARSIVRLPAAAATERASRPTLLPKARAERVGPRLACPMRGEAAHRQSCRRRGGITSHRAAERDGVSSVTVCRSCSGGPINAITLLAARRSNDNQRRRARRNPTHAALTDRNYRRLCDRHRMTATPKQRAEREPIRRIMLRQPQSSGTTKLYKKCPPLTGNAAAAPISQRIVRATRGCHSRERSTRWPASGLSPADPARGLMGEISQRRMARLTRRSRSAARFHVRRYAGLSRPASPLPMDSVGTRN